MTRRSPKEEFCWVVDPDERPVPLDDDERPALRLIPGGDEVSSMQIGSRSGARGRGLPSGATTRSASSRLHRLAIRHPRTALASACAAAFAVGWTLAGAAAAEARVSDWESGGPSFGHELTVFSIGGTNLIVATELVKGAST